MPLSLDDDDFEMLTGSMRTTWHVEMMRQGDDGRVNRVPSDYELKKRAETRRLNRLKRKALAYGPRKDGASVSRH